MLTLFRRQIIKGYTNPSIPKTTIIVSIPHTEIHVLHRNRSSGAMPCSLQFQSLFPLVKKFEFFSVMGRDLFEGLIDEGQCFFKIFQPVFAVFRELNVRKGVLPSVPSDHLL